jgi:hypothetical protein
LDVGDFVNPDGDGGCVVGSLEVPFVGYAGERTCGWVGGGRGARQICRFDEPMLALNVCGCAVEWRGPPLTTREMSQFGLPRTRMRRGCLISIAVSGKCMFTIWKRETKRSQRWRELGIV